jgi:putative transposase
MQVFVGVELGAERALGLRDAIQRIALKNRFYGYRRIRAELRREGFLVNHKRIQRLMRQDNLLCLRKRPFVPVTTDSQHGWPVVPNLARSMVLTGLDQLWVADITYVRMLEEFAYLAIVLDGFSRRVIGWALETHLQASLAIAALKTALDARHPRHSSLVHHSDRGVQYACVDYTNLLRAHGIVASMSRIGNPYDNAKVESFMKTLKQEEIDGKSYRDLRHATRNIGSFIEGYVRSSEFTLIGNVALQHLRIGRNWLNSMQIEKRLKHVQGPVIAEIISLQIRSGP